MSDVNLVQNDTGPQLVAELIDENGAVVDLTGIADTDVRFHMIDPDSATTKVDSNTNTAVVAPPTAGRVSYDWQAADTGDPGDFDAEFQVTFPDGRIITFPNYRYFTVKIRKEVS